MSTPFAQLSRPAQVARLRASAQAALQAYPLEVRRLRLLNHGFNTTFRVDTTSGERYALRLNVNSRRSPAQLAAEVAWLAALAQDTDLQLPVPRPRRDGALLGEVWNEALGAPLPATLFSWLPGRDLGEQATPRQLREVGRAAALLHRHAQGFTLPAGVALQSLRDPLMGMGDNLRPGPLLPEDALAVVQAVRTQVDAVLARLYAAQAPRPLHADLHLWNVKWHRGRLSVFDFDDSGLGLPVQDLTISAYYLRPKAELEAALLDGYAAVAPLPDVAPADYETLVAGRAVVLLNDLLVNTNAELQAILPRYVPNSVTKLRAYLDSGVFRHDVPGLLDKS
ncbi:phosphotransferase enzyme family protein [Deinococcus aquaedulcis]|uniref:phosphotransferase enzyme family protein n=1 Tax=Deinococcus aquaedulcis TaxID=2840455 RepID=UPI001C82D6CF|nr:phosphotransferase [Deinococcus aquaedulcis]